jgi:hypothetical protein
MKKANGNIMAGSKQRHAVVQAKTKKRQAELLQQVDSMFTPYYLNGWWSQGAWGNVAEEQIGDIQEEGVWVADVKGPNVKYVRMV